MGPGELPPPVVMLQMIAGRWVSQSIGVAAELSLADEVTSGPKTADEIAAAKGLHAGSVYRLMRALASFGIFAEDASGKFSHTPLSDALRSDVPYSMRGMARMVNMEAGIAAWNALEHSVRTGQSGFEHAHGEQAWTWFAKHPREVEIFANAMSNVTAQIGGAVAATYDFSGIRTLADIGGSHGMILSLILGRNSAMRGILFDRPEVVAGARPLLEKQGVADRVECVGGDFFERVPAGADAYIVKSIFHDWGDDDCLRILKTIHAAARPGAKLLVVEAILEPGNAPQFAKLLDIEMLAVTTGGRERTRAEWEALFTAGGFRFVRVVETPGLMHVLESVRV